jgi:hypothetical protein
MTAVEWLEEKYNYITWLRNRDEISAESADKLLKQFLEQAKEMELNTPAISGWLLFNEEKPLDGCRYVYSIGNQFFVGIWSDKLKGFILDGCGNEYISSKCDYFHACH